MLASVDYSNLHNLVPLWCSALKVLVQLTVDWGLPSFGVPELSQELEVESQAVQMKPHYSEERQQRPGGAGGRLLAAP